MGLIKVFLERPRILILTLIFFLLVGYSGFNNIPRQEMPELAERWGVVIQVYPGASPDRIETQVTEILEIKLREIPEIRNLNSNLRQGSATTLVELKDEVSFDLVEKVWSEVQDKIDLTEQEIPNNARLELSRNSGPPISALYSIQWKGDDEPPLILMSRLAEQLKRKLAYLGSTEEVEIHGEANEEIVVEVDSRKLSNLGISFQNLSNLIASFDNKRSAGLISNADEEILIKPKDNLKTISQLEDIPIAKYDSQLVKVSDIASVSQQAVTPIESYSIVDGNPAVIVQVTGSFDQRIDQYVSRANAVVEDFKKGLPEEIVVSSIYEESLYVEKRLDELTSSIGFALFLVLALSAFLLGLRSAILVALILPLTLCSVLFICQITGLPLHQTSTTGMIIALGLLIDNAIIVVEDYRYRRLDGLGSKQAIYKSVKHLFMPLLAATATTALAFMPIAVGEGPSNEYVGGMAKTLIMAVTSSLFLSLTVVLPTLHYLEKMPFLSSDIFSQGYSSTKLYTYYRSSLFWALSKPRRAILVSFSMPLLGLILFSTLDRDFFPANDRNMFQVRVELPNNSSVNATIEKVKDVREQLSTYDFIENDFWFVGRKLPRILGNVVGGNSELGSNNEANAVYFTSSYWTMKNNIDMIAKDLVENNPGVRIIVDQFSSGPPVFADIEYRIMGEDQDILTELGDKLELILSRAPDVYLTRSQSNEYETNLEIDFDNSSIAYSSSDMDSLISEINFASNGVIIGTMLDGKKELPIRLKRNQEAASDISQASLLSISGNNGIEYIENFSDIKLSRKLGAFSRYKGERENGVSAWTWPRSLPSVSEEFLREDILKFKESLPPGYRLEQAGEAAESAESNAQLFASAIVFFILILVGLVFALNSFRQTLLISSVAGLCVGLAILGLVVGMQNFGFIGLVGALGLAGLAINDSIVVLAALKEDSEKGDYDLSGVIQTVTRATRHIITTTATTIGGLFPLILTSIFFQPLAWAMSVGVIGASLIALFYIPAMFMILKKIPRTI